MSISHQPLLSSPDSVSQTSQVHHDTAPSRRPTAFRMLNSTRKSARRIRAFTFAGVCLTTLLFGLTVNANTPNPIGIMYLTKSDALGNPPTDLASEPCWQNPLVQGVALRTQWSKIQTAEATYDWSFLDQGIALAAQYGKKLSILITAGVTTPDWVYAAGAQKFMVTTQAGPVMPMPLPWDPVFQAKWGNVIRTFGARYDGNPQLAYVVMAGAGRRAESYFVFTPADQATFNGIGGLTSWKSGAEWIVDEYARDFPKTPFILDLGSPVPTDDGQSALSDVCAYSVAKYPGRFGVKSDGLAAGYGSSTFGATEILALSATTTVGFQMALPSKGRKDASGQLLLTDSLNIGINLGAHFIEVYSGDCDDPTAASSIGTANSELVGNSLPRRPTALQVSD